MSEEEADKYIHALVRDWRSAPLSRADMALCIFAAKPTHTPSQMSSTDLDDLRAIGFDDYAIHDATQVIGYFNYINRIADTLGVESEDFIQPWGK